MIKRTPSSEFEISSFVKQIDFSIPESYLNFLRNTDGAEIFTDDEYVVLWQLDLLWILNEEYEVNSFLPGFFLIGANGDETGYAIQKDTGKIFEVPFIGMSIEEAVMRYNKFDELIAYYTEQK